MRYQGKQLVSDRLLLGLGPLTLPVKPNEYKVARSGVLLSGTILLTGPRPVWERLAVLKELFDAARSEGELLDAVEDRASKERHGVVRR